MWRGNDQAPEEGRMIRMRSNSLLAALRWSGVRRLRQVA